MHQLTRASLHLNLFVVSWVRYLLEQFYLPSTLADIGGQGLEPTLGVKSPQGLHSSSLMPSYKDESESNS